VYTCIHTRLCACRRTCLALCQIRQLALFLNIDEMCSDLELMSLTELLIPPRGVQTTRKSVLMFDDIHACIRMYVCLYVRMHACIYLRVCMYVYVCIYICIHAPVLAR
jgi:hypothetical protein